MPAGAKAPPILDFGVFYGSDGAAKKRLTDQIRKACLDNGFFQITNHRIPASLQDAVFEQSRKLFALPLEEKLKLDRTKSPHGRGYELPRSQMLEQGFYDLKEGFYIGRDLPATRLQVQQGHFGCGPNVYPTTAIEDPATFREVMDAYWEAMYSLARDILHVIALSLDAEPTLFDAFATDAVANVRLLHYPPQEATSSQRGIGAHTDFGSITLLLQGDVDGLQVWDRDAGVWVDVAPTKGAYVVNLGDLMMRWTNDRYMSNLHRVINTSGKERYSVPFFFNGNPEFLIKCLPMCVDPVEGERYPPITGSEYLRRRIAETYGQVDMKIRQKEGKGVSSTEVGVV